MSADDSLKNWQVADGGKGAERYALTGSETEPPKQMQLQEDASGGAQWQPIDYRRQSGTRRNWILPSVVIVALLGVLAYVGWIALGQVAGGSGGLGSAISMDNIMSVIGSQVAPTPEPTAETVAAAVVTPVTEEPTTAVEPSPTPVAEPTATETPAATPTPAPVELITGTVTEAAGVNARREPATTAEVVRLLPQNAPVTVIAAQEGWLQVILDDNQIAWVSADFIAQATELVALERLNQIRTAAGLPPLEPPAPAAAPNAEGPVVTLAAIVIGEPGINARNAPDLVSGVTVMQLNKDSAIAAVGRNEDSQWLAVELPEGGYGWVLTQFVSLQGDVATLAVVTPETLAALAAAEVAPAVASTSDLALAPTAVPAPVLPVLEISPFAPPAPFTNTLPLGAAVAISDPVGVNARGEPSGTGELLLVVPNGAVLPAVGRSEDGQWIQVQLPDARLAWMASSVVNLSDNIDSAPVGGVTSASLATATPAPADAAPAATPAATAAVPVDAPIATITNALGANLRSVPDRNANPVVTVNSGATFPAIGRTADGAWVQLALPDGTLGWALATTISLDADISGLPVAP